MSIIQNFINDYIPNSEQISSMESSLNTISYICSAFSFLAIGAVIASIIFMIMYSTSDPVQNFSSVLILFNSFFFASIFIVITGIVFKIHPIMFGEKGFFKTISSKGNTVLPIINNLSSMLQKR